MSGLRDPDTDEAPNEGDFNYEEYKKNQSELIAVGKKIKEYENNSEFDIAGSVIYSLVPGITGAKKY
ncbi:MAG: hypothetical protein ACLUG4_03810 [Bacilli bacterium]